MFARPRRALRLSSLGALIGVGIVALTGVASPASARSAAGPSSPAVPPSKSAAAVPGIVTFGVQPASRGPRGIRPDSRPYLSYTASQGGEITDYVAIVNYSITALRLRVYATDAVTTDAGGFGLLAPTARPSDVGAWVKLSGGGLITVPGRRVGANGVTTYGATVVPIAVRIPPSASPGDHAGGVVASLDTVGVDKSGARVRLNQRVATRMYIRIGGTLHPQLAIEDMKVTYHGTWAPWGPGAAEVSYVVHNIGNIKLGGRQTLRLSGWFGRTGHVRALPDIPLLLPGGRVTVRTTVPGTYPEIRITARVSLVLLKQQGDANPAVRVATASATTWAIPWTAVAIVVLLVLGLIVWWMVRRRRGRAGPPAEGDGGTPDPTQPDDNPDVIRNEVKKGVSA